MRITKSINYNIFDCVDWNVSISDTVSRRQKLGINCDILKKCFACDYTFKPNDVPYLGLIENFQNIFICEKCAKKVKEEQLSKLYSEVTIEDFVKRLTNRAYKYPLFTEEEIQIAKNNGFIIISGYSDDLMEFEGAIRKEFDCFAGGDIYFTSQHFDNKPFPNCNHIRANWCKKMNEDGWIIPWTYETNIPHSTFMIYNDGEPYCEGIVFSFKDIKI